MIIKKLVLESFGKFSNKSIEFKNGFNLIEGNNGDGKSTIMAFIKMMFYGKISSGKSSDILKNTRKKYLPWNSSKMSGAIEFECGDKEYRVHKDFKKSQASDKTTVYDLSSSEPLDNFSSTEVGSVFLGMELDEFERSVFIDKTGGFSADESSGGLAMRIANLAVSGDESISQKDVSARINAAKEELVSKNQKKGLLTKARANLEALEAECDELILFQENQQDLANRINTLEKEITALEMELEDIELAKKIEHAKKNLNAYSILQEKLIQIQEKKLYLHKYGHDIDFLINIVKKCKEIQLNISNALSSIQSESKNEKDKFISSGDYNAIKNICAKIEHLKHKLEIIDLKIKPLQSVYDNNVKLMVERTKRLNFAWLFSSVIIGIISVFLSLAFNKLYFLLLILSAIGLFVFAKQSKSVAQRLSKDEGVKKASAELNNALSELGECSSETLSIERFSESITRELSFAENELKLRLSAFSCTSFDELIEKINADKFARQASKTDTLNLLRNDFCDALSPIQITNNYEEAYSLYHDISQILNEITEHEHDIETISNASAIENISLNSVSEYIEKLRDLSNTPQPDVSGLTKSEIEASLRTKRAELNNLYGMLQKPERSLSEIYSLIESAKKNFEVLSKRYESLSLADEVLNLAISETNKGLGSYLSRKTGEYLAKLTSGKYADVLVSRDLNIETHSTLDTSFHEWKYFSNGEIDKVYLALRMAATDIIAEAHEPLPVFLDDVLSQYDDESVCAALEFLKDYVENSGASTQILFFTCHSHIAEMANKTIPNLNKITLSE